MSMEICDFKIVEITINELHCVLVGLFVEYLNFSRLSFVFSQVDLQVVLDQMQEDVYEQSGSIDFYQQFQVCISQAMDAVKKNNSLPDFDTEEPVSFDPFMSLVVYEAMQEASNLDLNSKEIQKAIDVNLEQKGASIWLPPEFYADVFKYCDEPLEPSAYFINGKTRSATIFYSRDQAEGILEPQTAVSIKELLSKSFLPEQSLEPVQVVTEKAATVFRTIFFLKSHSLKK